MPEDDEKSKALIHVSDLLGLSKGTDRLVAALERGLGNLFTPWQKRRVAKAEIESFKSWNAALKKSGLTPTIAELTLEDRASVRVLAQDIRQQENRESVAIKSIEEFNNISQEASDVEAERPLEAEWVDRFWRLAQDVTDTDMQSVWGRVLSRKACGDVKYSPRCLEALSLLTREEVRILERLASLVVKIEIEEQPTVGIILNINQVQDMHVISSSPDKSIRAAAGSIHKELLGSIGIFLESGWAYQFRAEFKAGRANFSIAERPHHLMLRQEMDCISDIGTGVALSPLGQELISLISAEPDPLYASALTAVYASFGLTLTAA